MIGNNSCGVHSVMSAFAGTSARTSDNLESMEILTYDGLCLRVGPTAETELDSIIHEGGRHGEIYRRLKNLRDRYANLIRQRYPQIPRRVSGYNLDDLLPEKGFNVARALTGTESTCVTILEATVHLVYSPPIRPLVVLGYPDVYAAGDHIPEVLEHKPVGLEGIDDVLIEGMKKKHLHPRDFELLPEGRGWLLVEFGGENKEEADAKAQALMNELRSTKAPPTMRLYDAPFRSNTFGISENLVSVARLVFLESQMHGKAGRIQRYLRKDLEAISALFEHSKVRLRLYSLRSLWTRSCSHSN
jgi:FAD/FMN-containing dehydrogenase